MKKLTVLLGLLVALSGCSRDDALEISAGSEVTVRKTDGVTVVGRLIEVRPEQIIVESRDGLKTTVRRAQIADVRATPALPTSADAAVPTTGVESAAPSSVDRAAAPATAPGPGPASEPAPEDVSYRDITIPAGTSLPLTLRTSVNSGTSNVEDPVRATLRRAITIDGAEVLPAGTTVLGHVTDAARSAKVKGRARVAFRFTRMDLPGEGGQVNVRTGTVARVAPATKKRDAATIGGGAVGGAIVGGILGGGDGAAKGAVIGGAGGTGVVLATRGKEVSLAAGTPIAVKLTAPLTMRVAIR